MIEGIPRISVLLICYKQEELIKKAIDSLLAQKDYIYEICISDDCSPDRTWEVLLDYSAKYPGLFKLNRNEPNIGIFENVEKTWDMPSGDIIYRLAGDDECGEDWFKTVIDFIRKNKIDYKNELFCIYSDYKAQYPNGDFYIGKQDAIMSGIDPLRISLRGVMGNRGACYSSKILKKFQKVSRGRSYVAETAQDRQLQLFAEKSYYIPHVGNVYNTKTGVHLHFNAAIQAEREYVDGYARDFIESQGYTFCKKDLYFFDYRTALAKSYRIKTLKHKLETIRLYILSFEPRIDFKRIRPKRYLFAIFHRLPHKGIISMTIH